MNKKTVLMTSLFSLIGCTDDIGKDNQNGGDGSIVCEDDGNGLYSATIDATDEEKWVYLSLDACMGVAVEDSSTDLTWDIGFQRFNPKINGGVSGSGGMEAAILGGVEFDAVTIAPSNDYVTDQADSNDDDIPEYALAEWFDYDLQTHILTPADQVYVLKTVVGDYAKLRFDDYYDDAGTSGLPQISWSFIDAPSGDGQPADEDAGSGTEDGPNPDDEIECASGTDRVTNTEDGDDTLTVINSESSSDWTCFSFSEASQVETDWDMAWKQYGAVTSVSINGMILSDANYDDIDSVPEGSWSEGDTTMLDDWYNYSGPPDHVVTPADRVYLMEDADGIVWKLEITSYYKDGELGVDPHHPNIRWTSL